MYNKRKKTLSKDDKFFIDNGIFTAEELEKVDQMIADVRASNKGREPTEEELLAFENCTEEEHFEKLDKLKITE